jgi:hypothetical protein
MVCTSTDGARSGALAVTAVSMERGSRQPPVSDSCCGTARSHSLLFFFSGWICGVEAAAMWPIQNLLSHPPAASFKFKQFCMYSPLRHEIRRTTSIQQRVGRFQESDPSEKSFFPPPDSVTVSSFSLFASLVSSDRTGRKGEGGGAALTQGSHPAVARGRYYARVAIPAAEQAVGEIDRRVFFSCVFFPCRFLRRVWRGLAPSEGFGADWSRPDGRSRGIGARP